MRRGKTCEFDGSVILDSRTSQRMCPKLEWLGNVIKDERRYIVLRNSKAVDFSTIGMLDLYLKDEGVKKIRLRLKKVLVRPRPYCGLGVTHNIDKINGIIIEL